MHIHKLHTSTMSAIKNSLALLFVFSFLISCKKSDEKLSRKYSEDIAGSWKLTDYVYNSTPADLSNQLQITSFYPLNNEVVLERTYDGYSNRLLGVYSIGTNDNGDQVVSIYYPGTGVSMTAGIVKIKQKKMVWKTTAGSDVLELTFEKVE